MAQTGSPYWNDFFPRLVRCVVADQRDDGSWFGNDHKERSLGPVYSTSLAILPLTPADQLLPIYQR